ncbi:MAG: quercetin 2,3-dioxygenase [Rhodospirillaceae bacterium]|nr:MAG: quercetin 2,3-dioxygenase [Rhodospirillaceae bacterium]
MRQLRHVVQTTSGLPTSDGAGVRLTRIIGSPEINMVDPFLLLDTFESDQPDDYIGGFPSHPHRGFQTVTYLLEGRMRHKDSVGHEGVIEPGGVQWMSAGRGVVHSEMPEQENGVLFGFQLWVNLPASEKMSAPDYQEFPASELPVESLSNGGSVKVIAGRTNQGTEGPVHIAATDPLYLDVRLDKGTTFQQNIPATHAGFVYVIDGSVTIGEDVAEKSLGVLGDGDFLDVQAGSKGARFLLIAGKRLDEPVARGGPFVMNTKAEIVQAFEDYNNGQF